MISIYLSFFGSFQPRRSSAGWKRSCCGASANACDAWPRRQKIFVEDESPPESWWMNRDEYSMMIGMNWVVVCFFSLWLLGYFYVMNWDVIVGFLGLIGMCIYWDLLERILNDDWDILGVYWDQIPFPLHIFRKKPRNNGGSIEHEITHWDHTMKLFNIFQCWGDGNINKLEQK